MRVYLRAEGGSCVWWVVMVGEGGGEYSCCESYWKMVEWSLQRNFIYVINNNGRLLCVFELDVFLLVIDMVIICIKSIVFEDFVLCHKKS